MNVPLHSDHPVCVHSNDKHPTALVVMFRVVFVARASHHVFGSAFTSILWHRDARGGSWFRRGTK